MDATELKTRRKRLGLTQADLAERFTAGKRTVAGWEIGEAIRYPGMIDLALRQLETAHAAELASGEKAA